jgi:mannose-6-phosphate isomerase-like protein (cupin superfamily)
MKRTHFLSALLAGSSLLASPLVGLGKAIRKFREGGGFYVAAGKSRNDKTMKLFEGDTFFPKISSEDTNGDMFLFESSRIKEGGPAHHYHFDQDEWWYVLEGEFLIKVGDKVQEAKKGDMVFGPRMVPHSFAKVGEAEGKLLMMFQPAGKMEDFFTKMSQGIAKGMSEPDFAAFCVEHGFKRVGPAITKEKR